MNKNNTFTIGIEGGFGDYVRCLLTRLVRAYAAGDLTIDDVADLALEYMSGNYLNWKDTLIADECQDPLFEGLYHRRLPGVLTCRLPKIDSRQKRIENILDLQKMYWNGMEALSSACEKEAGVYLPALEHAVSLWNQADLQTMSETAHICFSEDGEHQISLTAEESSRLLRLFGSVCDLYSMFSYEAEDRWKELAENLEADCEQIRRNSSWPWYYDEETDSFYQYYTSEAWKSLLAACGCDKYSPVSVNPCFQKKTIECEPTVSRDDLETKNLQVLYEETHKYGRAQYDVWEMAAEEQCITAAEFMILLTSIYETAYPEDSFTILQEALENSKDGNTVCLSSEDEEEITASLTNIFNCFQTFHLRTSSRWRKNLEMKSFNGFILDQERPL